MASRVLPVRSAPPSRNAIVIAAGLVTVLVFGPTFKATIRLGLQDDRYLQVVVAPLACALLLSLHRNDIFSRATLSPQLGILLLPAPLLLGTFFRFLSPAGEAAPQPLAALAMVVWWIAAFAMCSGLETVRAALYPLCCLFLMIPPPATWMERAAAFLQHGSATVAFRILQASGMPVLRHGMQFSLPGLDFEVAPECSGIHSSVALLMVALVAGYLCLRSGWSRLVLLFLTVPIALIKNATRIVAITTLSVRVDRSFIDGPFHHRYGGAIFSTVAVVLFVLVLAGLQRLERGRPLGSAHPIGPRSDTVVQVNPAPSATGTTSS